MSLYKVIMDHTGDSPQAEIPGFRWFTLRDINPLGGTKKRRRIKAPNDAMRAVHREFIKGLRGIKISFPHATGAAKGCSPRANAARHRANRYFYLTDLHDAYHQVDGEKLARIICIICRPLADKFEQVHAFLSAYCLDRELGGLIVGAPSSPDLFNLYAGITIDTWMSEIAARYGLTYTRYLDDLTFSSPDERRDSNGRYVLGGPVGEKKRKAILAAIRAAGFEISWRKTKIYDLAKKPIHINGVGLEYGGRIFLPDSYQRRIAGLIHGARQRPDIPLNRVAGYMGVFRSIVPHRRFSGTRNERRLNYEFERLRRERKVERVRAIHR